MIQVCSPGRLGARRSALLAIGFYLGSDTLRRYSLGDLTTSFAEDHYRPRGRRLVLYDAEGDFDRNFDWWKESGKHRLVESQLPFENGRSDLLTGSGSRLDIQNINLLATLLVHAQYQGFGISSACSSRRRWKHCSSGIYSTVSSMLRGSERMIQRATTTMGRRHRKDGDRAEGYLQGGERCARPLHGRANLRSVEAGVRQPIHLCRRWHFSSAGAEHGEQRATWGGTGTRKGRAHYVSQARPPPRPLRRPSGA
jgi:hypothetical protein